MAGKPGSLSMKPTELPARYRTGYVWDLDLRRTLPREIAADLVTLWTDLGGVDGLSSMELALCERVVFLRWRLISYESAVMANASRQGDEPEKALPMTAGEHSNCVNVLLGLLKTLGLKRRARDAMDLHSYLNAPETNDVV